MTDSPPDPQKNEKQTSHQSITTAVAIALLIIACAILFRYVTTKPNHMLDGNPQATMIAPPSAVAFSPIEKGAVAPDFTLPTLDGKEVSLAKLHDGKNALVVFYAPCGSG